MNLATMREKLSTRRAELQAEFERLPELERLQAQIDAGRVEVERFKRRRDWFAEWGSRKVEISQPPGQIPALGTHVVVEMEPRRSRLTGKELAAKEQRQIDEQEASIRALEAEIKRLLKGRS